MSFFKISNLVKSSKNSMRIYLIIKMVKNLKTSKEIKKSKNNKLCHKSLSNKR